MIAKLLAAILGFLEVNNNTAWIQSSYIIFT